MWRDVAIATARKLLKCYELVYMSQILYIMLLYVAKISRIMAMESKGANMDDRRGTGRRSNPMTSTRQERRTMRRRRFVTVREAREAAWLAHLDYKVSGETGALKVPAKGRTWHKGNRANGHKPPPGRPWSRSGPAYLVEAEDTGKLLTPVLHSQWRRLQANE